MIVNCYQQTVCRWARTAPWAIRLACAADPCRRLAVGVGRRQTSGIPASGRIIRHN